MCGALCTTELLSIESGGWCAEITTEYLVLSWYLRPPASLLDLDLNIHTRGQIELRQRVHRTGT